MLKSDAVTRKFVDSVNLTGTGWQVEGPSGWVPVTAIHKTVPYETYTVLMDNGIRLNGADTHIVIRQDGSQAFLKDVRMGNVLRSQNGLAGVVFAGLTGGERHMFDLEVDSEDHLYYTEGLVSHNTTVVAAFLLWETIFLEDKKWAVLANLANQALEIMDRYRAMYQALPYFLQMGVRRFNLAKVELENDSSVFSGSSNPDTVRGKSLNGVYWDEAAFTARDEEFWTSTEPVLSSGDTTKAILTSTPKGARGVFHRIWKESMDPEAPNYNGFKQVAVPWHRHPRRDEKWKQSAIGKLGPVKFKQEHELSFLGSSGSLISPMKLEQMGWMTPISEEEYLRIFYPYDPEHKYIGIVDSAEGVGQDSSVISIIDVTTIPYKLAAKYRNNEIAPIVFPYQVVSLCTQYGTCPVLIETNNDVGGQVSYIVYYELEYEGVICSKSDARGMSLLVGAGKPGIKTTRSVKSIGCANLKALIESDRLVVEDSDIIDELGTFVAKGGSFEADEGCHDDCVATLFLFSWLVKSDWFKEYTSTDIQKSMYEKLREENLSDLLPVSGYHVDEDPGEAEEERSLGLRSTNLGNPFARAAFGPGGTMGF